jgi:hypothetical protein
MDDDEARPRGIGGHLSKRWLASAGLVASGLLAGGIIAGTQIAGAQTPSPTASARTSPTAGGSGSGADVGHGPDETLLTGTTADKVEAAALKEVPGGTIIRVETDSEGSPYEAHVRKSDGTVVTVKVDESFQVTGTETGFGGKRSGDSTGA